MEPRRFSLNDGGPFYRCMVRLRLIRPDAMVRAWWLAIFAWAPIAVLEGLRLASGLQPDPTFYDLSIHARLLVALPMMLVAERLVESSCNSGVRSLYAGGFCARPSIDAIVGGAERLRDAWWPEAGLLALSVAGGQLALWQFSGAAGLFHGGTGGGFSLPRIWYTTISLPLALFVMYRWLWHWGIWSVMLLRFARLPLSPIATHPDLAAGLSCLSRPVTAFGGFAFAIGAVLAGAWGTQILRRQTTLEALYPELFAFLALMIGLAVTPLLFLSRHLYKVRRRELAQYGDFANRYARAFDAKWVRSGATGAEALGASDIQSLSDLGNAFGVIIKTRLVPFSLRQVLAVWFAALLPMLPLFASIVTVQDLLRSIVNLVLRGLPI